MEKLNSSNTNFFEEYFLIKKFYLECEIPTETSLSILSSSTFNTLMEHCRGVGQKNFTEEEQDEWMVNLQPILKQSLIIARQLCNERYKHCLKHFHSEATIEKHLVINQSTIKNAGFGLFSAKRIEEGQIVCYYTGLIHNYKSKSQEKDSSYIALVGYVDEFDEDIFVNPQPLPFVKARYINDPLNESKCNVMWQKNADLGDKILRSCLGAVMSQCVLEIVATKTIEIGDEICISYGEQYWQESDIEGTVLSSSYKMY